MNTLVSPETLAANLDNPDWLVMDCRFSLADADSGTRAYAQSHIPGAWYVNLDKDLSTPHIPGKTGRHPLPGREQWLATVSALGISPDKQVILYDDAGGAIASRMWWMLRWIGHEKAALLDGGWQAWNQEGYSVTSEVPPPPTPGAGGYDNLPSLTPTVEAGEIDTDAQLLLDARELPRFRGDTEPLDPVAGHIPGALCSPFSANLDGSGRFLGAEELRKKFKAAEKTDKPVVCYCGSGVTAAHNILAMTIAGFDTPALYPGSWSDWITDPSRPVATGDSP